MSADVRVPADIERLLAMRPRIVVDTAGPFQDRDYALAAACAARGIHFVDIADGPHYVADIRALDSLARAHGALVVSGASTVPAVSTAIAADLAKDPSAVVAIEVGISPAQRSPRGVATVRSVLRSCGKPLATLDDARLAIGWSDLRGHRYPRPIGLRWLSNVDTPERLLWPARFPMLEHLCVQAGWELAPLHLGLTALSWLVRLRLVRSLERWAGPLSRIAATCDRFGTDAGAMHVSVTTRRSAGAREQRTGTLVALAGDGPQIPATPAALIVKKLLGLAGYERLDTRGAQPCLDLFTLDELMNELGGRAISYETKISPLAAQPASRKNAIC
jgi:hypothetical protein